MKDFGGRIILFTTTTVQAQKHNNNNAFSWAKNTDRDVRFLLGFNMYLILAQCEHVYLFLALAPKTNLNAKKSVYNRKKKLPHNKRQKF